MYFCRSILFFMANVVLESSLFTGIYPGSWAIPRELVQTRDASSQSLNVGVPRENFFHENRVPITPDTVAVLTSSGHKVFIETNAGMGARFTDRAFSEAGASIVASAAEVFRQAEYILKVSPLSGEELVLLRENQKVISAVHIGSLSPAYVRVLMQKNITAVGFEFFESQDGSLPFVQMMSEIAGVSSIHIAAELLTQQNEGQGILLGGITGIPPAKVTIIGAGTVGFNAARTALGMGARVLIIDQELYRLRAIEKELGVGVYTAVAQRNFVRDAVTTSDVIIGAAFKAGSRAPLVISEDMVQQMREGSVIVDVAIDQGGCVETSRLTTHDDPTFIKHGVIHYCVPNIPSRVSRTASIAISNVIGPMLLQIGENGGFENQMKQNDGLKNGVYIYRRHLTKETLANMFNMPFRNIELLLAAM